MDESALGKDHVSGRVRPLRRLPGLGALALLVVCIALSLLWSWPRAGYIYDFGSFFASGRAAAEGQDPYGIYPLTFKVEYPTLGIVAAPNLNPPISVPIFRALAGFDPQAAFYAWYAVALALYLLIVWLLLRAYPRRGLLRLAWALGLAGLWHTLELGQVYVHLLLIATLAWLALERGRSILAGVLIGLLVAIKPSLAVWPLLLLLGGHWTVALMAGGVAALLSLVPVVLYGPGIYLGWLRASNSFTGMLLPGNSSLPAIAARLGLPWLGPVLAAGLVLGIAALVWRRRPPALAVSGLGIVASLLASPITWVGYTLLVLPILYGRRWSLPLRAAAVILAIPFPMIERWFQVSPVHFVVLGSLYGGALMLVLAELVHEIMHPALPEDELGGPSCSHDGLPSEARVAGWNRHFPG